VNEHPAHAQRIGHATGVLTAGAPETLQGVAAHIVAPHDGNALHGVGHGAHGNLQRARSRLVGIDGAACCIGHPPGQLAEALRHRDRVQGLIRARPENSRKIGRLDPAQQHVRVRDGQRTAAPITRRAGIGARGFGTHAQARAVEANDGTAARRDAVNAHHGCANPHAADFRVESALVFARKMTDVGGSAAHVEADESRVSGRPRGLHHADYASRRPR